MPHPRTDRAEARRRRTIDQLDARAFSADPTLERVARIAAAIAGASGAAVHVIDDTRQYRIAGFGAPLGESPRQDSLCRPVVESGRPISTPDAVLDGRFAYSPAVRGDEPVRYFSATPLTTSDRQVLGTICVWDTAARAVDEAVNASLGDLADVVVEHLELNRAVRMYAEEALTDALTGLPNRRLLLDTLQRQIARHRRAGLDVTVVMLDLDDFKPVNDELGHEAGDLVLETVGRRLQAAMREDELAARIGGDEFVLVLLASADEAVEAVRRALAAISEPISTPAGEIRVTASAGWSEVIDDDTPDRVLRRADVEMYLSKLERSPSRD